MKPIHLAQQDKKDNRIIYIILEKSSLQTAIIKKTLVLLNGDDHANYIENKLKKNPSNYRPDILHQSLLTLLDSPLNKSGKLKIYITTMLNQVIQINSLTRIPRTYKRFSFLFAQLLKKLSIRAQENSQTLLSVIKSPIELHLPSQSIKIAMSTKGKLVNIYEYITKINQNKPIVIAVGAVAKGNPTMEVDYIDDSICISKYSLSASVCIGRIMNAFQQLYQII